MKTAVVADLAQARFDLLARAMHQHESHAQRREKIQIVCEIEETAIRNQIAAERDDERLATEGVYVGRDRLEPVDEAILAGQALTASRLRGVTTALARLRLF